MNDQLMPLGQLGDWDRDVRAVRRYLAGHEEPAGGWTPEHLMHGAKAPMLGGHGEGNDDRAYCERLLAEASRRYVPFSNKEYR